MKASTGIWVSVLMATFLHACLALETKCTQRKDREKDLRPVPGSCNKFYVCSQGNLIPIACPLGSVFHEASGSCVQENSKYDNCTKATDRQFSPVCPSGATGKRPHPDFCALYYDCSKPAMGLGWPDHMHECEFPELFNDETMQCEYYSNVSCGFRREPVDACEYAGNSCNGHSHCVPCYISFPSCRGKPDGMNIWEGKSYSNSPIFVLCYKQRVIYSGMCPQRSGRQVFDKTLRICSSVKKD